MSILTTGTEGGHRGGAGLLAGDIGQGPIFTLGEVWDAFVFCDAVNKDAQKINIDGYNWINFTDNCTYGGLWLATGVTS